MDDIRTNMRAGKYDNKIRRPHFSDKRNGTYTDEQYTQAYKDYWQGAQDAKNAFRDDLCDDCGVSGHPKAQRCFDIAWDHGHSGGLEEVYGYFSELSELLK